MVSTIDRAVTRIRHELRERLLEETHEGVADLLDGLEIMADQASGDIAHDLRNECERWRFRFDMLASLQSLAQEMFQTSEAA